MRARDRRRHTRSERGTLTVKLRHRSLRRLKFQNKIQSRRDFQTRPAVAIESSCALRFVLILIFSGSVSAESRTLLQLLLQKERACVCVCVHVHSAQCTQPAQRVRSGISRNTHSRASPSARERDTHTHAHPPPRSVSESESARKSASESERVIRAPFLGASSHTQPELGSLATWQPANIASLPAPQLLQSSILNPQSSILNPTSPSFILIPPPSHPPFRLHCVRSRRHQLLIASPPLRRDGRTLGSSFPPASSCPCAPRSIHTAHHQRTLAYMPSLVRA